MPRAKKPMQLKNVHLARPIRFRRTVVDVIDDAVDVSLSLKDGLVTVVGDLETIVVPLTNVLRFEPLADESAE